MKITKHSSKPIEQLIKKEEKPGEEKKEDRNEKTRKASKTQFNVVFARYSAGKPGSKGDAKGRC